MNPQYRLVHFAPTPGLGARVPIGALTLDDAGVAFVRSPHLPRAECVGGRPGDRVLHLVLDRLEAARSFDELPKTVGHSVVLGEPKPMPCEVTTEAWVRGLFAPLVAQTAEAPRFKERSRADMGYSFFAAYHLEKHVRKRFDPSEFWPDVQLPSSASLYAVGENELLLMEPIVFSRPHRQVEEAAADVSKRFSVYRVARDIEHVIQAFTPKLIAFALHSVDRDTKAEVLSRVTPYADLVYDVDRPGDRMDLVEIVRRTVADHGTGLLGH